jgi:protein-L-isoaspartate(D-aspartate) O-methyltransferase
MIDFVAARRMMVDGQVRTNDVTDPRLIAAMLEVPRELFVSADKQAIAYLDRDILLTQAGESGRYLLKPMLLAKLVQLAAITERDRVLDVGCATGYASAVVSRLAAEVIALEQDRDLAKRATEACGRTGLPNVSIVLGPLAEGWPDRAPYDVILLEGSTEVEPAALFAQLKEGGRLVAVQPSGPAGKAVLYRKVAGLCSGQPVFDAAAPLLPGFGRAQEFVF